MRTDNNGVAFGGSFIFRKIFNRFNGEVWYGFIAIFGKVPRRHLVEGSNPGLLLCLFDLSRAQLNQTRSIETERPVATQVWGGFKSGKTAGIFIFSQ